MGKSGDYLYRSSASCHLRFDIGARSGTGKVRRRWVATKYIKKDRAARSDGKYCEGAKKRDINIVIYK